MRRTRKTEETALRKKIGSVLESRRRSRRVGPSVLASASDVDLSQLGKVLRGRAGVSLYALARICMALDLDPVSVLDQAMPRRWRPSEAR